MNRRALLQTTGAGLIAAVASWSNVLAEAKPELKGSQMIIVTFEVEFEDDQIQQKRDAIRAMDEATAKEAGCIAYKSSFDANNSRILRIFEMWDSMDMLIPHFSTPHMAKFQAALGGLKSKSMDAKVYQVSGELPFPN